MRPVRVTLIVISTLFLLSQSIAVARAPAAKHIADDDDQGTSPAPRAVDPKTTAAVTETKEAPAPPAPPLPGEDQFLEARRYHEAGDLVSALPLYEKAAQVGFYEALYYIGQIHEASVAGIESNVTRAVEYYNQSAKRGYPEAMSALGFMYATGRGVDQSIPKSLVYHTFAASGDDMEALRVLGNRYLFGLGVVKNCETSLVAYEKAARMLIEETEFTGVTLVARINLIDEETAPETAEKAASEDDVIEYYRYHAETGDPSAQTWLGSMHMEGWRVLPLEASDELAYEYFKQASAASPDALAHLGYLHLKGRHVEQDNKTAVEYFKLAAARGSTVGMTHLGFLYLRGIAVTQDVAQAFRYFKSAADAGAVEGHNQLGIMHLHGWGVKADPVKAYQYFQNAKKAGHVGATYQFARMHDIGIAPARRSCATAAALYKRVAESVPYTDILKDAYDLYSDGEYEAALVAYERAALMGFEVGQSNAAYIYDRILAKDPERNATEMRLKALTFYELAAEQRRASAYLRIGDFHYYGIAGLKKVANELGSAHAAWNLGYMYQWGEGLARDLHLAKRFYDASAERSPDATIPAFLARLGLYIHIAYEWLTTERIAPETIGSALAGPAATSATSGGASTPPTLSPTAAQLLRPPRARIAGLEWDTFLLSFCTGLLGLLLWMRLRRQ